MLQKLSGTIRLSTAAGVLLVCILSFSGVAQGGQLPRVGTIKDYPATGLMAGCANLYFYPAHRSSSSATAYVFLARGDGDEAWMNLDGRDVRLRQIKSLTRENGKLRRFAYRLGTLRISVVVESLKEVNEPYEEGDSTFKMKITLRRGRAAKIVQAVGDADC